MSERERIDWAERWAGGDYRGRNAPSALIVAWADRLPKGRALDLACGSGRNALYLAERRFEVDAMDIAEPALKAGPGRRPGARAGRQHHPGRPGQAHHSRRDLRPDNNQLLPQPQPYSHDEGRPQARRLCSPRAALRHRLRRERPNRPAVPPGFKRAFASFPGLSGALLLGECGVGVGERRRPAHSPAAAGGPEAARVLRASGKRWERGAPWVTSP